jgi:hypothetical protein
MEPITKKARNPSRRTVRVSTGETIITGIFLVEGQGAVNVKVLRTA